MNEIIRLNGWLGRYVGSIMAALTVSVFLGIGGLTIWLVRLDDRVMVVEQRFAVSIVPAQLSDVSVRLARVEENQKRVLEQLSTIRSELDRHYSKTKPD